MQLFKRTWFLSVVMLLIVGISITQAQDSIILITDVQGDSNSESYPDSPFEEMTVTIEGVVTGDFQDGEAGAQGDLNGFYVQEEAEDVPVGNTASSAIYVFERRGTVTDVSVGDVVQVTGTVDEIRGLTQLEAASVTITGSSVLEPVELTLPVTHIDDWEAYENMLVTVSGADDTPLTVNETFDLGRYGSIQVASGGRVLNYSQVNTPTDRDAFEAYREAMGLRVLVIDDGRSNENPVPLPSFNGVPFSAGNTVRSGYTLDSVTGILEFRFDEWRIQPTEPIMMNADSNPRTDVAPDVGGDVRVGVMNVLNYFNGNGLGDGYPTARGADSPEEFERQREKTLSALRGLNADIIGLVEIENDFNTGINSAVQDLVNGLNAEPDLTRCGANWAYVDVSAEPLRLDRLGSDSIAVGVIYCEATVSIAPNTVPAVLEDSQLDALGIGELAPVFNGVDTNRVPLAVTFQENASGEIFTVVVNHFKSKGGSGDGANADSGNGAASWNQRRQDAVTALDAWLATNPTGSD
ncbi:MAG: ExeM/NucH family extracellular endonuclease, partial [Chloroflexota bacterium]